MDQDITVLGLDNVQNYRVNRCIDQQRAARGPRLFYVQIGDGPSVIFRAFASMDLARACVAEDEQNRMLLPTKWAYSISDPIVRLRYRMGMKEARDLARFGK
jgi:hypothetical protein